MNINKSKIAFTLGGFLFLSVPLASALADQKHYETQQTQQGDTMKSIESELRGYVKSFKADDSQMMQQHLNKLLQLSEKASKEIPAKISAMSEMDHSTMDMQEMSAMDHATMDMQEMSAMDHSTMDMQEMSAMDHSTMDMQEMSAMDHSTMDMQELSAMDHSTMNHDDMDSAEHDMSTMPSMEGMSQAQHHQHIIYMQGVTKLHGAFAQLVETQDKHEIKAILGEIKAHIQNHQLFR